MTTREQLTHERLSALIRELGDAEIISDEEAGALVSTRSLSEAREVRRNTPEPPAVSRAKVSSRSHRDFSEAMESGETDEALFILWEVLTGEDVRGGY